MPVRAPMPLLFPVMAALVGTVGATAEPARFTIAYSQAHHPAAAELRRYLYLLTQQQCVEAEPLESSLTDEAAGGCLPALLELRDDTDAAVLNSTLHASAGLFVLAGSSPAEERTAFEFLGTALEGWAPLGTAGAVNPGEHDHVVHSTGPLTSAMERRPLLQSTRCFLCWRQRWALAFGCTGTRCLHRAQQPRW